jgi:hypothetical protein
MWTNIKSLNFYINDLRFFLPNSQFIILATYAYKKNTKQITISGLQPITCCNI